jgi:hypothetical protein
MTSIGGRRVQGFRNFEIRNPSTPEFLNLLKERRVNFGNAFIGYQTSKAK